MKERKISPLYRLLKPIVRWVYLKIKVADTEDLPEEPAIYVGNHTQMNGPLACEFYFPVERYTWCAGQMMELKEVPAYAFADFWSEKPKRSRWLYKIASYLIAPVAVLVFKNANTIGVYRDSRLLSTFKQTVNKLQEGKSIVIFPEHNKKYNHILYEFEDHFVDVARLYHKRTGKELCFVPFYLAPYLKTMYFGKPLRFNAEAPIEEERQRIRAYLMDSITDIACGLPRHTVVPYRNIPRKEYPCNIPDEE